MKVYKANRKGLINYMLAVFLLLPFIVFAIDQETFSEKPFLLIPLTVPLILFASAYFNTYYQLNNDNLHYRSGFLKGTIPVSAIRKITVGETMWVGTKPALARKGMVIMYNKYDEIYIAPENNDEIVADLKTINPTIEVNYKR